MKCTSTKELDSFQTVNAELMLKISALEQQLINKDEALEKGKVELLKLKEENRDKEFAFAKIAEL